MPEIAIITPMYNAAATLAETVASGRAQTFGDWEWYLMDDGSSDNTVALARDLAAEEPRMKVVENGRVAHIGTLRNRALRKTTAPLVAFLDADDVWHPEFLNQQRSLLRETNSAVGHSAAWHLLEGQSIEVPPRYTGPRVCEPPAMLEYLARTNPIYSPSVVLQREALMNVGGFSEHPDHFSVLDGDLWLKLAPRQRFAYNESRLLRYRVTATSLSGNPKNLLRNRRGDVISIRAAVEREFGQLDAASFKLLHRRLGIAEEALAQTMLDQPEPELTEARTLLKSMVAHGHITGKSLLFYSAALLGKRPPLWLQKLLRWRAGGQS
jgi:glycosyltransferase involved in cell wall biosynthesis